MRTIFYVALAIIASYVVINLGVSQWFRWQLNKTLEVLEATPKPECPTNSTETIERWGMLGWSYSCMAGDRRQDPWQAWEDARLQIEGQYHQGERAGVWRWFSKDGTTTREQSYEKLADSTEGGSISESPK